MFTCPRPCSSERGLLVLDALLRGCGAHQREALGASRRACAEYADEDLSGGWSRPGWLAGHLGLASQKSFFLSAQDGSRPPSGFKWILTTTRTKMSMSLIQCLGRSRSPSCHRFFLSAEFKYCIVGCAVAVWVALPFMKIFDVVSDAVIYSLFVQDMAKPAPPELIDEVLPLRSKQKSKASKLRTRTCGWSRPLSTIRNLAHCGQTGSLKARLPELRQLRHPAESAAGEPARSNAAAARLRDAVSTSPGLSESSKRALFDAVSVLFGARMRGHEPSVCTKCSLLAVRRSLDARPRFRCRRTTEADVSLGACAMYFAAI